MILQYNGNCNEQCSNKEKFVYKMNNFLNGRDFDLSWQVPIIMSKCCMMI